SARAASISIADELSAVAGEPSSVRSMAENNVVTQRIVPGCTCASIGYEILPTMSAAFAFIRTVGQSARVTPKKIPAGVPCRDMAVTATSSRYPRPPEWLGDLNPLDGFLDGRLSSRHRAITGRRSRRSDLGDFPAAIGALLPR